MALHIFIKDARRFWWEIAVMLGLLADVARMDATRVGFIPGAMEGWLNLILPAVWAYLVALVIHDEALVGDRQFWLTGPYPWPALLVAKALFVLVFIHLFSFAADVAIVAARGFEPLAYLPQLLLKQLVLAAALTVPAAALAAVTRNLPQFIFAGVAIATVGLFSLARIEPPSPWVPVDEVRRAMVLAVLAPFGTAIVLIQYARRWTAPSRALGLTAALLAGMLFMSSTTQTVLENSRWFYRNRQTLSILPGGQRRLFPLVVVYHGYDGKVQVQPVRRFRERASALEQDRPFPFDKCTEDLYDSDWWQERTGVGQLAQVLFLAGC